MPRSTSSVISSDRNVVIVVNRTVHGLVFFVFSVLFLFVCFLFFGGEGGGSMSVGQDERRMEGVEEWF